MHFTAIEPTSLSGNFNLYCGAAMLLLVPLYLLNSRTRLGDKVLHILLTAFLLVSLNTNMLTYVWHGFHFPNGLPGRFSFIYIFLVLSMGYEGWRNRRYAPKWTAAVSAAAWLAFLGYCWWGQKAELETYTWGVTIGVILIYAVLLTAAPAGTEKTSDRGIASDVCHTDRSLRLRNFWPVHERHGEPERLLQ